MASMLAPNDDGAVEVIAVWVAPSARGQGVGDLMIGYLIDWARSHYPRSPVQLSVKFSNRAAAGLYRRHGFLECGAAPHDRDEQLLRREPADL